MAMKSLQYVLENSSQPGLNYFMGSRLITRVVWITVILVGLGLTIFQIGEMFLLYIRGDVMTSIDLDYNDNLTFPTIILCNTNQIGLTYYAEDMPQLISEYNRFLIENEITSSDISLFAFYQKLTSKNDSHVVLNQGAYRAQDMILRCQMGGYDTCDYRNFTRLATDIGFCYAFNTNISEAIQRFTVGSRSGLTLLLNLETYEKIQDSCKVVFGERTGLVLGIVPQGVVPILEDIGIDIPLGFSTKISLNIEQRERLRNCLKSDESWPGIDLYPQPEYSGYEMCVQDHSFKRVIQECKCVPYNLPNNQNARNYSKQYKNCTMQQHNDCVTLKRAKPRDINSKCARDCETTGYTRSQTVSEMPDRILPPDVTGCEEKRTARCRLCQPSILDQNEWQKMRQKFVRANEATYRFYSEFWQVIKELIDELREKNERLVLNMYIPLTEYYLPTFDRIFNNISCIENLFSNRSHITDRMALDTSENVDKAKLLQLAEIPVPDPTDNVATQELYLENQELMEPYELLLQEVEGYLAKLWYPYNRDNYRAALPENLTEYNVILNLTDHYELAYIDLANFASHSLDDQMDIFWGQKYQQGFLDPIGVEYATNILEKMAELAEQNYVETILKNETLLALATMSKLKSDQLEDIEKMRNFLSEAQNCSIGRFKEQTHILYDDFIEMTSAFLKSIEELREFHADYIQVFDNKKEFIKKNFIELNIFYNSLAMERLTQTLAYTEWSLLCDVGGALGLFLGATLLAVFEFGWLLVEYYFLGERKQIEPEKNNVINMEMKSVL